MIDSEYSSLTRIIDVNIEDGIIELKRETFSELEYEYLEFKSIINRLVFYKYSPTRNFLTSYGIESSRKNGYKIELISLPQDINSPNSIGGMSFILKTEKGDKYEIDGNLLIQNINLNGKELMAEIREKTQTVSLESSGNLIRLITSEENCIKFDEQRIKNTIINILKEKNLEKTINSSVYSRDSFIMKQVHSEVPFGCLMCFNRDKSHYISILQKYSGVFTPFILCKNCVSDFLTENCSSFQRGELIANSI